MVRFKDLVDFVERTDKKGKINEVTVRSNPSHKAFMSAARKEHSQYKNAPEGYFNPEKLGVGSSSSGSAYSIRESDKVILTGSSTSNKDLTIQKSAQGLRLGIHENTDPENSDCVYLTGPEAKKLKEILNRLDNEI